MMRVKQVNLLHRRLTELSPRVLGVDIDCEGIDILSSQGFNVRCENAETMDLGEVFDTIIAGEIIEHLDNPGHFLRNMKKHLTPQGTLAISTPNPFYINQSWKILRKSKPAVHNEHTCWFDPQILCQLLEMTGLRAVATYWIQPKKEILKTWPRLFRPYFSHSFMILASRQ
jgi:SAM-dependent methyltransferase